MSTRGEPAAIVVGAGPAGLAAAAALGRAGIDTLVLERAERPGESWHRRYRGLRLNTVRWMSSLPGYAAPKSGKIRSLITRSVYRATPEVRRSNSQRQ